MNFKENILFALAGIKANKMRAFLTMLGIIIGISSVIMITTMGSIVEKGFTGVVSDLGVSNLMQIYLTYKPDGSDRRVTEEDYITEEMIQQVKERFGDKIKYSVYEKTVGTGTLNIKREDAEFTLIGTTEDGAASMNTDIIRGRFFTEEDVKGSKYVCVIPSSLANRMYGSDKKAVGQVLNLTVGEWSNDFVIIGVYKYKESAFGGMYSENYSIQTPISTALRITGGSSTYSYVNFTGADDVEVIEFSQEIRDYLNERYYKNNDAFELGCDLLVLLVADHLRLDHVFNRGDVEVAFLVDAAESHHEEMIVVSTLIEWRHLACLGVEDPLHGLACAAYASHVVL